MQGLGSGLVQRVCDVELNVSLVILRASSLVHTDIHMDINMYICMYVCNSPMYVCLCVILLCMCVCV